MLSTITKQDTPHSPISENSNFRNFEEDDRHFDTKIDGLENHDYNERNPPPSKVIHIRNIDISAIHAEVEQLFLPFGQVNGLVLIKKMNQGLVEMHSVESAERAINFYLDKPPILRGKYIYLTFSRSKEIRKRSTENRGMEERNERNDSHYHKRSKNFNVESITNTASVSPDEVQKQKLSPDYSIQQFNDSDHRDHSYKHENDHNHSYHDDHAQEYHDTHHRYRSLSPYSDSSSTYHHRSDASEIAHTLQIYLKRIGISDFVGFDLNLDLREKRRHERYYRQRLENHEGDWRLEQPNRFTSRESSNWVHSRKRPRRSRSSGEVHYSHSPSNHHRPFYQYSGSPSRSRSRSHSHSHSRSRLHSHSRSRLHSHSRSRLHSWSRSPSPRRRSISIPRKYKKRPSYHQNSRQSSSSRNRSRTIQNFHSSPRSRSNSAKNSNTHAGQIERSASFSPSEHNQSVTEDINSIL